MRTATSAKERALYTMSVPTPPVSIARATAVEVRLFSSFGACFRILGGNLRETDGKESRWHRVELVAMVLNKPDQLAFVLTEEHRCRQNRSIEAPKLKGL